MKTQIWCLTTSSVGVGGSQKRNNGPSNIFVCEKAASISSLPDARHLNSSLLSLVPFKLLPQHWSSEGILVSPCMHPLGEIPRTPEVLCFTQPQSLLAFTARNCRDFSSWHWTPGVGDLLEGWTPCSSQEKTPLPRQPSQFLPPHVSVALAHSMSPPLLPALMWLLLYILSCRTSIQPDFRWF